MVRAGPTANRPRPSRSRTARRWPRPASATASASSTRWSASISSTPTSSPTSPRGNPASVAMAVWRWLGRVPFAATAREQEALRQRVLRGDAPETLLLCEHDPVVTLGRSADPANVLAPRDELARRGVEVHAASRGGDVTYHGPGQLVGYPIVHLRGGVLGHVTAMARAIASVLGELGIDARWRRETPDLWVDDNTSARGAKKICAFGVHVHRRVAIHGFALNVAARLGDAGDGFDLIVPCGLRGTRTTSIG